MPFSNNRNSRSGKPNRIRNSNKEDKLSANREKDERPHRETGSQREGLSNEQSRRFFDKDRSPRKSFGRSTSGEYGAEREPGARRENFGGSRSNVDREKRKTNERNGPYRKSEDRPYRKDVNVHKKRTRNTKDRDNEPKNDRYSERSGEAGSNRLDRKRAGDDKIRLNRYIANSGVCSRRKADELIEAGVVTVNGEVVTTLGTKVDPARDEVRYNGERLKREKMVYVLLNKPKDYITTTDDPQERRTVMQLVEKASRERIYPVGRLDRNTTGLLLMTNDGDLADRLSHPKNNITKIYHVELDKNLGQGDFNKIEFGLELEDGFIKPDTVSYVQGGSKREIGIQIHSGRNRIVRRIFEHLGYSIIKLDRVIYANLTKKDLPRGRWRYLEEREIIQLKHFIK